MKRFVTTALGGLPIVLDDLRFLEDSYTEIINAIVAHDPVNPIILSGCVYDKEQLSDTDTLDMTAGYIYFAGEIYQVDAINRQLTTVGGSQEIFYWQISSSFDPAGNKTFQNATTNNTYQIRKANVVAISGSVSGLSTFSTTKHVFEIYRAGMTLKFTKDPMDSYVNNFGTYLGQPFRASTGISGEVVMSGIIENSTGLNVDKIIGTLGAAYRPDNATLINASILDSSLEYENSCTIEILPSGQMKFISTINVSLANAKILFSASYLK